MSNWDNLTNGLPEKNNSFNNNYFGLEPIQEELPERPLPEAPDLDPGTPWAVHHLNKDEKKKPTGSRNILGDIFRHVILPVTGVLVILSIIGGLLWLVFQNVNVDFYDPFETPEKTEQIIEEIVE